MKEPVIANPLDQTEKQQIFENIGETDLEKDLLKKYIDFFIKKNKLGGYETEAISKRKLIASLVLAVAVFLEIVYHALYHKGIVFFFIFLEIIFYFIFFRSQSLKRYLVREVIRRPEDNLDNILISQVSGAKSASVNRVFSTLPLVIALVAAIVIFMHPHMIFEKNSSGGYSLRYYTKAIIPEEDVIIPDSYNGELVTEIRGSAFVDMDDIKYVYIPTYVTEIRGSTFENCSSLEEVDLPEGITRIGGHAFCDCPNLSIIFIPSTIQEIGSSAFRRCYSLEYVEIPEDAMVSERAFKESPTEIYYY